MEDSYYESRDSSTWLEGLLYPCSDLVFLNGLVSKPRLSTGLKLQQPSGTMERTMKVLRRATDFFNLGQTATLVPHPIWPKAGKQGVCFHLCITRCNSDLKKKKKKSVYMNPFGDPRTTLWNWFSLSGHSKDQMCVIRRTQWVPLPADSSLQPTTHT